MTRTELLTAGIARIQVWCSTNCVKPPDLGTVHSSVWRFGACAYYRPTKINICVEHCASPGYGGRAWSWPGYVIDRTPYGVVAHELGHHVDWSYSDDKGSYWGNFSKDLRRLSGEPKLTNYCPNDAEWFAEMFRLFVTNADLLSKVRPRTYRLLRDKGLEPVSAPNWKVELHNAPERIALQAQKKFVVDNNDLHKLGSLFV